MVPTSLSFGIILASYHFNIQNSRRLEQNDSKIYALVFGLVLLFSSEFRPFILFNKQVVLNVSDSAATPCDEGDLSSLEWRPKERKKN